MQRCEMQKSFKNNRYLNLAFILKFGLIAGDPLCFSVKISPDLRENGLKAR